MRNLFFAVWKKETDLALRDQIRRLMALPPERRCNFLRKRIAYRISCFVEIPSASVGWS
jgi:hypothetical protein